MWAFGGGAAYPSAFESQYHCSSTAMAGRDVDEGDKIFLPPSALDKLARMNVEYPMLFQITNNFVGKKTHCGVLEFSAEEGWCYMPFGMMQNLMVEEGALITVKNKSLPKATFVKFRAQSVDFLEVSNPRALLEVALRKFTCLTVGDTICIPHSGKKYFLDVREVQPSGAASIIETDCNVDFEEPLGYKESKYAEYERKNLERRNSSIDSKDGGASEAVRVLQKAKITTDEETAENSKFKAFSGSAKRIDGKAAVKVVTGAMESKSDWKDDNSSKKTPATSMPSSSSSSSSEPPVPFFKSSIGDKYSKKKTAVSAFTGTAHKLQP